jgi:hypothetical protein
VQNSIVKTTGTDHAQSTSWLRLDWFFEPKEGLQSNSYHTYHIYHIRCPNMTHMIGMLAADV